jgi:chemotaxis protein MotA
MISLPLGALLTAVIFIYSVGLGNFGLYANWHSLILVGGGTISILFFSTPLSVLKNLKYQAQALFRKNPDIQQVRPHLIQLAKNRFAATDCDDEMIRYAQDLWAQGVAHELFIVLLSQKRKELEQKSVDCIQSLKNLAKYPPALGMAGTVMGIVTLFQSLDGGKNKIGPALAMAMTATFFGLAIANGLVMPLADRLQVRHIAHANYLSHLYQILLLINQEEAENLIADEVTLRAG